MRGAPLDLRGPHLLADNTARACGDHGAVRGNLRRQIPLPVAGNHVKLLPNVLTAARLAVAPWLFYLLWHRQYGLALIVIFIAGVTDGLDGLLARKLGATSKLGGISIRWPIRSC